MRIFYLITSLFLTTTVGAQALTTKDLRLVLEGRASGDSLVTVEELLKLDKVKGNYPWLTINEITVTMNICVNSTGLNPITCSGNVICAEAKQFFPRLRPGAVVLIESINATNRSGHKLPVEPLVLRIKD